METTTLESGAGIKSPESKADIFNQVARGIAVRTNLEMATVSSFKREGREYPIDSVAAGVMAMGQTPSGVAEEMYQEILSKIHH